MFGELGGNDDGVSAFFFTSCVLFRIMCSVLEVSVSTVS